MKMIKIFLPQEYGKQQIEIASSFQCGCCKHNVESGLCKKFERFKPIQYELGDKICPKFEQEISLEPTKGLLPKDAEAEKNNIREYLNYIRNK